MKKIFLGNLPFEATQESVGELLKSLPCSATVDVPRDRRTGKARGFAFVEIENDDMLAEYISILGKQKLNGRDIKASEVHDRAARSGGGRRDEPENERV